MSNCKAPDVLRNKAYNAYPSLTKDVRQRSRWAFFTSLDLERGLLMTLCTRHLFPRPTDIFRMLELQGLSDR